jgi:hypothetical protein
VKKITIGAVRRAVEGFPVNWHGVVLQDGQMERVLVREGAYDLVTSLLGSLVTLTEASEGTRITVEVTITGDEAHGA